MKQQRTRLAGLTACGLAWVLSSAGALGDTVVRRWKVHPAGTQPKVAKTSALQGQYRMNVLDLSGLPRGAAIRRADLRVTRAKQVTGLADEAMADVNVALAWTGAGGAEKLTLKRLQIRGPWYDRLDATEAVRAMVGAGAREALVVIRSCPYVVPDATCLDVWYEGTPKHVPPQVTAVKAFHRAGQTFITWNQIEDPVGRDKIKWGELKSILDNLDKTRQVRYAVLRHNQPITAANLHEAELIATVKPLSCWNVNGRNIDRPVDDYIASAGGIMTGQWNPFDQATQDGRFGKDCPIDRLVIRDGGRPLNSGTGLYVHTVGARAGPSPKAYYAVLTAIDGALNTRDLSPANAPPAPVAEQPGAGRPVLQRELPKMSMFNYPQKTLHYVRWVAAPYVNVPSQYYNWTVGVPNELGKNIPLELNLHRERHSYWRTHYRIERDSIVLSPHDFPIKSWWYGYHESLGTLRSFKQGVIHPYTERRLLAFVDFAAGEWPVDRNRVLVTGCRGGASGSAPVHLGIRHPEVFNLVISGHARVDYAAACRRDDKRSTAYAQSLQAIWGKVDWDMKTAGGKSVWAVHDLLSRVRSLPRAVELPFFAMSSHRGYEDTHKLYELLLAKRCGIMATFSWGGARYVPVSRTGTYPNVIRLDIARDKPLLSFTSDQTRALLAKRSMGDFNRHLRWRDVAAAPNRFEATLFMQGRGTKTIDVTLRRCRTFKPAKGSACVWTNTGGGQGRDKIDQSGKATVAADGLLTLEGVTFSAKGSKLVVALK